MEVETLHTNERLPKEVDKLEIVGGNNADYALGEVRKCPECETYYLWFHDHDSESGVGYGYTDESITRMTKKETRERLERNIKSLDTWIEQLEEEANDPKNHEVVRESARERIPQYKKEIDRLKKELKKF